MKKVLSLVLFTVLALAVSVSANGLVELDPIAPVLKTFPTIEPEGEVYRILYPKETVFYLLVGKENYENLTLEENGIIDASWVDYNPKTMVDYLGDDESNIFVTYKVIDGTTGETCDTNLSYSDAKSLTKELNGESLDNYIVVAENPVHIVEIKVAENASANFKLGTLNITATLNGKQLSARIVVVSDIFYKNFKNIPEVNFYNNKIAFENQKTNGVINMMSSTVQKESTDNHTEYDFISSIYVSTWPDKLYYYVGETIDTTGMKVSAIAYKLNEEENMYYPFEIDITDSCWIEPSVVNYDENQNVEVLFEAPADQFGNINTFNDRFRITVFHDYKEDDESEEFDPIYDKIELNLGKDAGYSAFNSYEYENFTESIKTPANAISTKSFKLVAGGEAVINGNNFTITIPKVPSDQKGINFYYESDTDSIKFISDTVMQSDYLFCWYFGNYFSLRESFGEKTEDEDIVTYYIYNDDVCIGKRTFDYMYNDVWREAKFYIEGKAGDKLGSYTISVEKPEGNYNIPEIGEAIDTGFCGGEGDRTNLEWKLDSEGTLTISGEGKMADYDYIWVTDNQYVTTAPWGEYSESIKKLVIENGVTTIGDYAFYGCQNLSGDIVIPASVEEIGYNVFINCGTDCYIFEGAAPEIISNGSYYQSFDSDDVFYYNWKGKDWTPDSNGGWGGYESYVYDNGKTELRGKGYCGGEGDGKNLIWTLDKDFNLVISGKGKMKDYNNYSDSEYGYYEAPWKYCCSALQSFTIEDGVTSIGSYAFGDNNDYYKHGFTGELKIPASVTSIGRYAFANCSGFTGELKIPASVTSIGDGAFYNCSGFTGNLLLPRSLKTIAYDTFSGCTGFNGTLTIPRSVTNIESNAFYNCSGFTGDLVIPEGVERLGGSAFSGCTGFNGKLSLPESLRSISESAFYNCSGFTGELDLKKVNSISSYAFSGCSGFTGNLDVSNLYYIYGCAFENCSGFTGSLSIIAREIGAKAFSGCTGLDGYLTIGENIETIGEKAFENCNLKGKITFGEKLTHVGGGAFSSCENIREFEFLGEAPIVVAADYENRSFAKDSVLYYTFGWDYWTSPTWEGYTAIETSEPDAVLSVSSGSMGLGATKEVSVTLSENSGASNIQFALKYDPDMLKVVSCTAGSAVSDAVINYGNEGIIYFVWEDLKGLAEKTELMLITFTTAENASLRETNIEIDKKEEFVFADEKWNNLKIETINGAVKIVDVSFGDINLDGKINVLDANAIRRCSAKLMELNEKQLAAADVDGNGKVNVLDANLVRRYAAKIINIFPVEE